MADSSFVVSYTLDRNNRIISVGGSWDCFALENDAAGLLAPNVVGRDISDFIVGDSTLMFLLTMINATRLLAKPMTRSYRCDSPQYRRFMEMTLLPGPQDVVEIHHRLLREEPMQYPLNFTVTGNSVSNKLLKRCSMCNWINVRDTWLEPDEAVQRGWLENPGTYRVIYGVCESCQQRFTESSATLLKHRNG
jgi:hypothetical protein